MDAIYSPPHLALFIGGLLVTTTGIRAMWAKRDIAPDLPERFWPVTLSVILFLAMTGFVTMYLSPWMQNVAPTSDFANDILQNFDDNKAHQDVGLNPGLAAYGDDTWPYEYFSLGQAMGGMVISARSPDRHRALDDAALARPVRGLHALLARLRPDVQHRLRVRGHHPGDPARAHRPGARLPAAAAGARPGEPVDARADQMGRAGGGVRALADLLRDRRDPRGPRVERGDNHRRDHRRHDGGLRRGVLHSAARLRPRLVEADDTPAET